MWSRTLAAAAVALVLAGCSGGPQAADSPQPTAPSSTASPTPKTFTVQVQIEVSQVTNPDEPTCFGRGGYDDMRTGAQVKITNAGGEVIAIGALDSGQPQDNFPDIPQADACRFKATIQHVPLTGGIYGVEVSKRGVVNFEQSGDPTLVKLTLG